MTETERKKTRRKEGRLEPAVGNEWRELDAEDAPGIRKLGQ